MGTTEATGRRETGFAAVRGATTVGAGNAVMPCCCRNNRWPRSARAASATRGARSSRESAMRRVWHPGGRSPSASAATGLHKPKAPFMVTRLMSRPAHVAFCVAAALAATPAWANGGSFSLDVSVRDAGEPCPDAARVRDGVTRRLGRSVWNNDGPGRVAVTVTRQAQSLRARVALDNPDGSPPTTRVLEAPLGECAQLLDAAALSISIAVDPLSAFRPETPLPPSAAAEIPAQSEPPEPQPLPAQPAPTDVAEDAPVAPPTPTPPAPAASLNVPRGTAPPRAFVLRVPNTAWRVPASVPRLRVGLSAEATLNALGAPHAVVGGLVAAHARFGVLHGVAEVRAELPGFRSQDDATVLSRLSLAGLGLCVAWRWVHGCGVGLGGVRHVQGTGAGFESSRAATLPFVAAGPRVGLAIPVVARRTDVLVQLDVWGIPFLTRLRDASSGTVFWMQPPVTAVLSVGTRAWVP